MLGEYELQQSPLTPALDHVMSIHLLTLTITRLSSPTIPLLLELTRQLLDPTKYNGLAGDRLKGYPQQLAAYLAAQGGLEDLRTHILSFVSSSHSVLICCFSRY